MPRSTSCRPYAGDALPDAVGVRRAARARRGDGRQRRRRPSPWLAADQGPDPRGGRAAGARSSGSAWPPARGRGARRRGAAQPARPARRRPAPSAGRGSRRTTRCSAHRRRGTRASSGTTTSSSSRPPTARRCWPSRPTARSRWLGSARGGGCSCTPRSTGRSSALGRRATAPSTSRTAARPGRAAGRDRRAPGPSSTPRGDRSPTRFAELRSGRDPTMSHRQPASCVRLGFGDASDRASRPRPAAVTPADAAARRCSAARADPDAALARGRLVGLARRQVDGPRTRCCAGARRRRGHRDAAARGARRQHGARRPPRPPPRALARAHRPDARARPAPRRTPCAQACCAPSAPTRDDPAPARDRARRRGASTRCGWSTAGSCCASPRATSPTTSASTTSPPSSPTWPAGTLEAALAVARARVGETRRSCRLAVIAMGKCGGHELNYVSDVDVIFVAEPADGRRRADAPCAPPPSSPPT